jgi:hypothetical protein
MTTTNQNRAIYRVAMRQLEARDFIRWAAAEPDLNPLEAELLARYAEVLPLAEYCEQRGETGAETVQRIEQLEDIEDAAGGDVEEIEAARRALVFVRNQEGFNAPLNLMTRWRNAAESEEESPVRYVDGARNVVMPARFFEEVCDLIRDLENDHYRAL